MHTYHPRWPDDRAARTLPNLGDFRFNDALDLARYAELDWLITWRTWPDVWHLADDGAFRCGSKGSSLDSVRTFAEDPSALLRCRETVLDQPCPDRWLVIEPRHPWREDQYRVDEGDAQAFLTLRRGLADDHGITLLDVVVFDQELHWWSLHELTSGTTKWP
jgi:hypothetical protein